MKKKNIIMIISGAVIVLVVLFVSGVFTGGKMPEGSGGIGFDEFLQDGGTHQCLVTQNIDLDNFENSVEGFVYIHNGMVRGLYDVEVEKIATEISFVARDGFIYTWNSLAPFGTKTPIAGTSGSEGGASMSGSLFFDTEKIADYQCMDWDADLTLFDVPTDITFQTI